MANNLPMLLLLLTVAFLGFISIDEAEARPFFPGSVELERESSLIEEFSRPATLLVPSPSSPYGPSPLKSSVNTDDDATTTMISETRTTLIDLYHDDVIEDNNNSNYVENIWRAKSPPPPPPRTPPGPSPACRANQEILPANCETNSPAVLMVVDTAI